MSICLGVFLHGAESPTDCGSSVPAHRAARTVGVLRFNAKYTRGPGGAITYSTFSGLRAGALLTWTEL